MMRLILFQTALMVLLVGHALANSAKLPVDLCSWWVRMPSSAYFSGDTGAALNVDCVRNRFQMVRINAPSHFTQMVKFEAFRDWPLERAVGKNVSKSSSKFVTASSVSFDNATLPNPATVLICLRVVGDEEIGFVNNPALKTARAVTEPGILTDSFSGGRKVSTTELTSCGFSSPHSNQYLKKSSI